MGTQRKPLVLILGDINEIPSGDYAFTEESDRFPLGDILLPAGYSHIIVYDYTIPSGYTFEIGLNAVLAII